MIEDTGTTPVPVPDIDAEAWQRSWDRQQESYLPDREQRIAAMLDAVEAVAGPAPRILDLAGGTGTISLRALSRFPAATCTVLDVDDALLGIAAVTARSRGLTDRLTVLRGDLASPGWVEVAPGPFDAVLTATALHWLSADRLAGVYGEAATLLRAGGVLINADHHVDGGLPTLTPLIRNVMRARRKAAQDGDPDLEWGAWWQLVRAEPALAPLAASRDDRFAGDHADEFNPGMEWHLAALRAAGFTEVGVIWRGLTDAAVVGLLS